MENLSIHSAKIENFKNVVHCEFSAHGNNITLKGACGSGKTAIIEAITTALMGKELLPDDPIRHGAESSITTVNIGNGKTIKYSVKMTIEPDKFKINLYSHDERGIKSEIKQVREFFKQVLYPKTLDLQAFFRMSDEEQLQQFYSIVPGIKEQLDQIDADYKAVQDKRKIIAEEGKQASAKLLNLTITPGLPEEEEDPALIMEELRAANEHNAKLNHIKNDLIVAINALSFVDTQTVDMQEEIKKLEQTLLYKKERLSDLVTRRDMAADKKSVIERQVQEFETKDTSALNVRIANINTTNKQIRDNKEAAALDKLIESKREEYSKELVNMKKLDEDRAKVFTGAKMPIEGLSVKDGALVFPDPATGEIVRINSLSTGQKYRVGAAINSALIPENGMHVMFISSKHEMDKENYDALLEATKGTAQLVFHETAWEQAPDSKGVEIIIE